MSGSQNSDRLATTHSDMLLKVKQLIRSLKLLINTEKVNEYKLNIYKLNAALLYFFVNKRNVNIFFFFKVADPEKTINKSQQETIKILRRIKFSEDEKKDAPL